MRTARETEWFAWSVDRFFALEIVNQIIICQNKNAFDISSHNCLVSTNTILLNQWQT